MVKVMRSIVVGPLAPYVAEFAAELLGQGYTRCSAEQHVCFVAHLDRWLQVEGLGLRELSESTIARYLAQRRVDGYRLYLSRRALHPLLDFLAPKSVFAGRAAGPARSGGGAAGRLPRLPAHRAWPERWDGRRLRAPGAAVP